MAIGHYENFPVASLLLPAPLRQPVEAIYRFARSADDLADEGSDPSNIRLARLNDYRTELDRIERGQPARAALFQDLGKTIKDHGLPLRPFHDLLDAFSQDVTKKRYASVDEVLDYCRRSANPVGRLLLHLFKRTTDSELRQSDAICTALQLTNFWQDIDVDYTKDKRIYLPQDEMAHHGVTERHLAEKRCDAAWRALLAFQIGRTRTLMSAGMGLGRSLPGRLGLEIRATAQGGLTILKKIDAVNYDVFRRRPVLQALDWPLLILRAV